MGAVFKKHVTRALPFGATVSNKRRRATVKELRRDPEQATVAEQVATWRDRTGEKHSGVVILGADGSQRVRVESGTYYAKFRDGDGLVQELPTGCRDKQAAQAKLSELERMADRVKVGVVTSIELATVASESKPINRHIADYLKHLANKRGKGKRKRTSPRHVSNVTTALNRIVRDCGFNKLSDIQAEAVASWVTAGLERDELAPRTFNAHVVALKAFCGWAVTNKRLRFNPVKSVGILDEFNGQKRPRRALTADELGRLLTVARLRPVAEFGRTTLRSDKQPANARSRKTWSKAPLEFATLQEAYQRGLKALSKTPDKIQELEELGRHRALIYKTLVLTGLRKGELTSVCVADVHLQGSTAWLSLDAESEKSGNGAELPLRADLAGELQDWLTDRRELFDASQALKLAPDTRASWLQSRLFDVPSGLIVILDRDLKAAGIAKSDERGRTVDVHAMRHTFASLLSAAGVAPRTAQEAMRHSDISLTMRHYTDPKLLDIAGAMNSLPSLSLTGEAVATVRDTGTDGGQSLVAPTVAPRVGKLCHLGSKAGNSGKLGRPIEKGSEMQKPQRFVGVSAERAMRFELTTSSLGSYHSTN